MITLATTFFDSVMYPATALAQLYNKRLQIETNFRHLKQTMNMADLHYHSVDGIKKRGGNVHHGLQLDPTSYVGGFRAPDGFS